MRDKIIHSNYTSTSHVYQLQIPMNIASWIPAEDSVRLLDAILERMDYSQLYAAYSPNGRKGISPKILFKILVYGYMNHLYSTREMETACKRDINFMYLLGGTKAPDHTTIARFCSGLPAQAAEDLYRQLILQLACEKELSLETVFIDGTKLEANAGRYTFVWKNSAEKNEAKMQEKMKAELPELAKTFGLKFHAGEAIPLHRLKHLYKQLMRLKAQQGIVFVHGTGKRKHPLQRAIEKVKDYWFESEENYSWCEANGQLAYIKPANYEQSKKKKYKTDIGRARQR